jgi:hypothetical protein
MKSYIKLSLGLLSVLCGVSLVHATVTTASSIDPAGGAAIGFQNPNFGTNFTAQISGTYTAVSKSTMQSSPRVFIMNFESANGYGTATQSLASDGKAFTTTDTVSPFNIADRVQSYTTSTGVNIGVEARSFNTGTLTLGLADVNAGVFLVGDRTANDVMLSGTQGLTAGKFNGRGTYLTFDQNLASFSATLNSASSATYYIALFNSNGSVIGTYTQGLAASTALYFGVSSGAEDIRSVWIGQSTSTNGVIIDDIAFVTASAVPEPATTALLMGGTLMGLVIFRRRARTVR